jgi:hypothetical protein
MNRAASVVAATVSSLPLIATRAGRTIGGITVRRISWAEFWRQRPDRRPATAYDGFPLRNP